MSTTTKTGVNGSPNYVTWKSLYVSVPIVAIINGGIVYTMNQFQQERQERIVEKHERRPHANTATKTTLNREIRDVNDRIDREIDRLLKDVERIENYLRHEKREPKR